MTPAPDRDRPQEPGAAPDGRRVLTVHAGIGLVLQSAILDAVEQALESHGVERIWVDYRYRSELVILAELDTD